MKRFLLILLCLLMMVGMVACGEKETDKPATEDEEKGPLVYAVDDVINRFFADFIETYNGQYLDTRSIRRAPGSANTKPEDLTKEYLAVINGCNVTLRNATYETENDKGEKLTMHQLRIIIEGGTTKKSRDILMNTFSLMAAVADPDCTLKEIETAVDKMEKMTSTGDYRVSTYLQVERYTPIVEEVGVPCKIEIIALNYVPKAK